MEDPVLAQYLAKIKETKELVKKTLSEEEFSNWKVLEKKDNYQTYIRADEHGNLFARGECIINKNIEFLADFVLDEKQFKNYDELFVKQIMLKEYAKAKHQVVYVRYKGQWPVSDRDFIILKGRVREGDIIYQVATTVDFDDGGLIKEKDTVRGHLMAGGWVLQKLDENKTKATYLSCSDPKGKIPDLVKNYVTKCQAIVAYKLKQCVEK